MNSERMPHQDYVDLWVDMADYELLKCEGTEEDRMLFEGMVRNDFTNNRHYSPAQFSRMVSWIKEDKQEMYRQLEEIMA